MTLYDADYIIFDVDGTISDPRERTTNGIAFTLGKFGLTPPPLEKLEQYIGPPLIETFKKLLGEEHAEKAVAIYRKKYIALGDTYGNKLYDGTTEVIKTLHGAGKKLFVATSKSQPIAESVIKYFGFDEYFTAVYGASPDDKVCKKEDLIALLLKQQGLPPERAVMVGDTKFDMIGATENGIRAVGALWGYGSREDLLSHGACALAQTPVELLALFLPEK